MTCGRHVPYVIAGITYYFTCHLPHGHEQPCEGIARDYTRGVPLYRLDRP